MCQRVPDFLQIDIIVLVDQDITQTGNLLPRNFGMRVAKRP
jgi:hypothetical protein